MITFASPNKSRQAYSAMPISRCDSAWLRALPEITGGVSVQGTAVKGGIRLAADVHTFPGTTAWSPPT